MTSDNTESKNNQGFTLSLEDTFLEKTQGSQIDPSAILGLNDNLNITLNLDLNAVSKKKFKSQKILRTSHLLL